MLRNTEKLVYTLILLAILVRCGPYPKLKLETAPEEADENQREEQQFHYTSDFTERTIRSDEIWDGTHLVRARLNIEAKLVLTECTRIEFKEKALLRIGEGGKLIVRGTRNCPVVFAGNRNIKGLWNGLDITGDRDTKLRAKNLEIKHAGRGSHAALWVDSGPEVYLEDTHISGSSASGVWAKPGAKFTEFQSITIENVDGFPVRGSASLIKNIDNLKVNNVGKPAIKLTNNELEIPLQLSKESVPYQFGNLEISAPLFVGKTVNVMIEPDSTLEVGSEGELRVEGAPAEKAVFRSSLENPSAGDWNHIRFIGESGGQNLIKHAAIKHGGGKSRGAIWVNEGSKLKLTAVNFAKNKGCALKKAVGANVTLKNTQANTNCPNPPQDNN